MTDLNHRVQFFLGANTADGFFSLYDTWVDQTAAQAFYVLKGGAGCGKSTLMGRVARRMEREGYAVEYIRCSGDPDSLDGIRIPGKGTALVDGTAPHSMDPTFVGATGHYLDLGAGYDRAALFPLREQLIRAAQAYRRCYPQAYRCLRAAEESRQQGRQPLHTRQTLANVEALAADLLEKEGKRRRERTCPLRRRFLSGVTCQGELLLEETLGALCPRGYLIQDPCGLAGPLLDRLEAGFLARGEAVIACPDPLDPSCLAHLLLPGLELAFVTRPVTRPDFSTLSTEALVERSAWQAGQGLLRETERGAEKLLAEGVAHLAQAKEDHDVLEALYHPHVDFSLVQALAEQTAEEILALPDR